MTDFWPTYGIMVATTLALLGLANAAVLLMWAAGVKWIRDEQNPMR